MEESRNRGVAQPGLERLTGGQEVASSNLVAPIDGPPAGVAHLRIRAYRMYYVYVLVSEKTGRFYVGSTDNVDRRLFQHNAGYSKSTLHEVPWRLVQVESFTTRAEAVNRERYYKTGKGREELKPLLA